MIFYFVHRFAASFGFIYHAACRVRSRYSVSDRRKEQAFFAPLPPFNLTQTEQISIT